MFWECVKMVNWAAIFQEEGRKHMKHIQITESVRTRPNERIWLSITDEYVQHKSYIEISYNHATKIIKCNHIMISSHSDNPDYVSEIANMIYACRNRMKEELYNQTSTRLYMVTEEIALKKP